MVVRALRVHSVEPLPGAYEDRYEWVHATADIEVESAHAANAGIVDLELAGDTVAFDCDVRMLRPTGGGDGGPLLAVVPNRGFIGGIPFDLGAPFTFGPAEPPGLGDGFLLERGWTVLWTGWQWDVIEGLGVHAPTVDVGAGWTRSEWRLDADADDHTVSDSTLFFQFADYPTADVDDPDAVLTVRTSPDGDRTVIPRDAWRFTDDTHVALDGGFQAFHWYELVYRTDHCPVTGVGLLAFRDVASHVRAGHDVALAYGVSQSGRFLRQFLYEDRNVDEAGRHVFDGVFAHIGSSRRGEFNHRYTQPSYTHVIGHSNLPPFDTASFAGTATTKVIETNTAWEYWRGDGALLHVDPMTGDDLPDHPNVRQYLLAGHDHLGGAMMLKDTLPGANPVHMLDGQRVLRALFLALHRWVTEDVEPPPSAVPRRADGTLANREEVLAKFPDVPRPDPAVLTVTHELDVSRLPFERGEAFVALVSDVDASGNEVAGIRVPELAAGDAAYTGWNPRRPVAGLPDVLYEFLGSRLPLGPEPDRRAMDTAANGLVTAGFFLEGDAEY